MAFGVITAKPRIGVPVHGPIGSESCMSGCPPCPGIFRPLSFLTAVGSPDPSAQAYAPPSSTDIYDGSRRPSSHGFMRTTLLPFVRRGAAPPPRRARFGQSVAGTLTGPESGARAVTGAVCPERKHRELATERRVVALRRRSRRQRRDRQADRSDRLRGRCRPSRRRPKDRDVLLAVMLVGHHVADDAGRVLNL